jgi:Zn ribbon nucleic-acid-binding protein
MGTVCPITDDSANAEFWRTQYPQFSYCIRCGYPWPVVISHPTNYATEVREDGNIEMAGCFPLCEPCWVKLATPEARMPYYVKLYTWWEENDQGITSDAKLDLYLAVKAGG